jgi:anti-sigma regulatory factor (Ser/Thr protein kinase)/serine/threonine protein phosphatase PrpC
LSTKNDFFTIFNGENDLENIRRKVRSLSITYGFKTKDVSNILKVTKEVFKNVVSYANSYAQLKINKWKDENLNNIGMEIIIEDFGPGISNFSKDGKQGFGFSIIKNLTNEFIIESKNEMDSSKTGLICTLHFLRKQEPVLNKSRVISKKNIFQEELTFSTTQSFQWTISGQSEPRRGESRNGDKVYWIETDEFILGTVIDGIGHGFLSDKASNRAVYLIENNILESLDTLINFLHKDLKETVGAQCFIIKIDKILQIAEYVGVGNIRAYAISNYSIIKDLMTKDGTLGLILPNYQVEKFPLNISTTIIIHSDGISKKWLSELRNLNIKKFGEKSLVNDLINNYRRFDDDSTVLVIQNN